MSILSESHVHQQNRNYISLDPSNMEVGFGGVAEFLWPVSPLNMESVRDCFQFAMVEQLREELSKDDVDWAILRILLLEILNEVLTVYRANAILQRLRASGKSLEVPDTFRVFRALKTNTAPDAPHLIRSLNNGLAKPNLFLFPIRALRNILTQDNFSRRRLRNIKRKKDIVSITAGSFVQKHAALIRKEMDNKVVLCSFWEWFAMSEKDRITVKKGNPIHEAVIQRTVECVENSFAAGDEGFPSYIKAYFEEWIRAASIAVNFHYHRILSKPDRIPSTLWYGSSNNIWTRILRAAVKVSGGRNIGHDHGRGVSLCPNRGEHGVVLDLCDEYVTYSPLLAKEFMSRHEEIIKVLPDGNIPKITGRKDLLPFCDSPSSAGVRSEYSNSMRKLSAMYIAPLWLGERVSGANCLPADFVQIDWQARLLGQLQNWDFQILFKVHPESIFPLPKSFFENFGILPVTGYVEDSVTQADIILFDFMSSAFRTIIFSDKPLVFVNFGHGLISRTLMNILERRCVIVHGWYDDRNRAQVDWSELQYALQVAWTRRNDQSCVNEIYGIQALS